MDDKFYIQKVIEGDTESFRFLIDRYKDKAFYVTYSIMRNEAFCDDIVQESFIKAFTKIKTYRGEASFSTWLMRIVVNESYKVLRRKKLELNHKIEISEINEIELNNSLKLIKEEEQKLYIDKTLKQMPQREALVLELFYLNDMSLKEMADVLNLKSDHVKVLLHRSRKQFFSILKLELQHELKTLI